MSHPYWTITGNALLVISAAWVLALIIDWGRTRSRTPAPSSVGPRRLTARQTAQIVQALNGRIGHVLICSYAVAPDSHGLAEDFGAAFRKAGWKADVSMQPTKPRIPPPSGIAIELPGDNVPQPDPKMTDADVRTVIGGAMAAAGIPVDVRTRCEIWTYAQFCIVIGARP